MGTRSQPSTVPAASLLPTWVDMSRGDDSPGGSQRHGEDPSPRSFINAFEHDLIHGEEDVVPPPALPPQDRQLFDTESVSSRGWAIRTERRG